MTQDDLYKELTDNLNKLKILGDELIINMKKYAEIRDDSIIKLNRWIENFNEDTSDS